MLNITKNVTLSGTSTFDNITAQGYQAVINGDMPESISMTNWIGDYTAYKAHRAECAAERTEFEDKAFTLQEQMIAEKKAAELAETQRQAAEAAETAAKAGQSDLTEQERQADAAQDAKTGQTTLVPESGDVSVSVDRGAGK